MSALGRLIKALLALTVLAILVIGIPIVLWLFGPQIPDQLPSWAQWQFILTSPDTGQVFLTLIGIVGWAAWASFVVSVALEIAGMMAGRPPRRIRVLTGPQRLAAVLIGAIFALSAAPTLHAAAQQSPAHEHRGDSHVVLTQIAEPDHGGDHEPEAAELAEPQQTLTYTVQSGDSLWAIAESVLGDGQRWSEIAELNYDRVQSDGGALDRQDRWLQPGWVLTLPMQAQVPSAQPASDQGGFSFEHLVQPGDTLSSIAATYLGDADRYMEIFEVTRHVDQGDGVYLVDPDLLQPGWRVSYSTAHTEGMTAELAIAISESSPTDPVSEPDALEARSGHESEPGPAPTTTRPVPIGVDATPDADLPSVDFSEDLEADTQHDTLEGSALLDHAWTAGGTAGLLAAGMVAAVAGRRAMAHRERRPGQRLWMPQGRAATLEAELRYVADSDGVGQIDQALRDLGRWHQEQGLALPALAAVRTRGGVLRLYLESPATLPSPWVGSHQDAVWTLPFGDRAALPSQTSSNPISGAPFPCLVTIGRDEAANVLIDAEHLGMVSIDGPADLATSALRAAATELAANPWTEGTRITLVGCFPELATALDTGRLRYVKTLSEVSRGLRQSAHTTVELLTEAGIEAPGEARGLGVARDAWDPEVVVVGTTLSVEETQMLRTLALHRGSGVVVIGAGLDEAPWVVEISTRSDAVLAPAGLALRPQLLDEQSYRAALDVLSRSRGVVAGPAWAQHLKDDGPLLAAPSDKELLAPVSTDGPIAVGRIIELHPPVVRVLGPVVLDAQATGPLRPSHESQALEIVAYLSLNTGVDGQSLSEAIWPGAEPNMATRNSAISRARTWLGEDPEGNPYLPRVADNGRYQLQGVASDWERFVSLVSGGLVNVPVENLLAALSLVRGQPFDRARAGRYKVRAGRYSWAEPHIQEMVASIVDVAYAAAARATQQGRLSDAAWACRAGLEVSPDAERLWRMLIRAQWEASDMTGVREAVDALQQQLVDLEADPEEKTSDLLDEVAELMRAPAGGLIKKGRAQ